AQPAIASDAAAASSAPAAARLEAIREPAGPPQAFIRVPREERAFGAVARVEVLGNAAGDHLLDALALAHQSFDALAHRLQLLRLCGGVGTFLRGALVADDQRVVVGEREQLGVRIDEAADPAAGRVVHDRILPAGGRAADRDHVALAEPH